MRGHRGAILGAPESLHHQSSLPAGTAHGPLATLRQTCADACHPSAGLADAEHEDAFGSADCQVIPTGRLLFGELWFMANAKV